MKAMEKVECQVEDLVESFLRSCPPDPLAPNYHNARKLKGARCVAEGRGAEAAFQLSEATAAGLRTMALYRQEQVALTTGDRMLKVANYLKPIETLIKSDLSTGSVEKGMYPFLERGLREMEEALPGIEPAQEEPLHSRYMRFTTENNVDNFLNILKELPDEWTVIQLTAPYNPSESIKPHEVYRTEITGVYVSLLRNEYVDVAGCGPLAVHAPANVTKEGELPLFVELHSLLDQNVKDMVSATRSHTQKTVRDYWERRQDIDLRMMSLLRVMDKEWLGGWKCLLTGKLKEKEMSDKVRNLVDGTIADWGFIQFTPAQKVLLCNLLESSHDISSAEIRTTLQKILTLFPDTEHARNIMKRPKFDGCQKCSRHFESSAELCLKCSAAVFEGVHRFTLVEGVKVFMESARQIKNGADWQYLRGAERHPVIMIVDEMLDTFPWESCPILAGHPVSRIESIHLLYSMFKTHEDNIVNGHFVVKRRPVLGRYVINPANNLDRMAKRMSCFVSYWCPDWAGERDKPPEPQAFLDYLCTSDLFLYCGHGDGCQYACGDGGCGVETAAGGGVRAAALLSGCSSVRLQRAGGRVPPLASHYHYHIAGSPMVVGMLWEVTDLEVDKVVTTLLALLVPSRAPVPWESVGKAQWSHGTIDINVESKGKTRTEPDLLRAIAKARRASSILLISTSVVARGLPVTVTVDNSAD